MFLVAGSGGATAVTRGLNGNIPPRVDSLTQVPATLVEWHDKPQRTPVNIFAIQGNGRRIMQCSNVKVLDRKLQELAEHAEVAGFSEYDQPAGQQRAVADDPGDYAHSRQLLSGEGGTHLARVA